jgi:hypothetical protein
MGITFQPIDVMNPKTMNQPDRILLVYNAESGLFNALNDWVQKAFSGECRGCRLCHFTYGLNGMRRPWKEFIESLPCPATFLYRAEFQKTYPDFESAFPAIFTERAGKLEQLVSTEELAELENLTELIEFTCDRFFGVDYQTLLPDDSSK